MEEPQRRRRWVWFCLFKRWHGLSVALSLAPSSLSFLRLPSPSDEVIIPWRAERKANFKRRKKFHKINKSSDEREAKGETREELLMSRLLIYVEDDRGADYPSGPHAMSRSSAEFHSPDGCEANERNRSAHKLSALKTASKQPEKKRGNLKT